MFARDTWFQVIMLTCCFQPQCSHHLCQKGKPATLPTWYSGGPPITHLPLPIVDVERPWGNPSCPKCDGVCAAHYRVEMIEITDQSALHSSACPPSSILKDEFSTLKKYPPSDDFIQQIARKVLLTPDDTRIWLDHLHTILLNRKRGALKAAATRKAKKSARTSGMQSAPLVQAQNDAPESFEDSSTATTLQPCVGDVNENMKSKLMRLNCGFVVTSVISGTVVNVKVYSLHPTQKVIFVPIVGSSDLVFIHVHLWPVYSGMIIIIKYCFTSYIFVLVCTPSDFICHETFDKKLKMHQGIIVCVCVSSMWDCVKSPHIPWGWHLVCMGICLLALPCGWRIWMLIK